MTVRPDYGPEYGDDERRSQRAIPEPDEQPIGLDRGEPEEDLEELELDDNEAHVPGQVCARCGRVLTATDDTRMQADRRWVHEVCPPDFGTEPPADTGQPAS